MAGVNKVIIIGNLGQDPEVRYTGGGTAVANLRVACSERIKNKNGEYEDKTEWIPLIVFGRTAENCGEFLRKGSSLYAEGRMQTRQWEDRDGNKRQTTEVVAFNVVFLDRAGGGSSRGGGRKDQGGGLRDSQRDLYDDRNNGGRGSNRGGNRNDYPTPPEDDDIPF